MGGDNLRRKCVKTGSDLAQGRQKGAEIERKGAKKGLQTRCRVTSRNDLQIMALRQKTPEYLKVEPFWVLLSLGHLSCISDDISITCNNSIF
jgi:hypothetical protein